MQVGLIGAGNMARALARGWGDPIVCSDGGSGRARELVAELGGEALQSNRAVAERADLVVLCHKPYQLAAVAGEIRDVAKAVASVLGGVGLSRLESEFPGTAVFAVMPNTPVEVRRGTIIVTEDNATEAADAGGEPELQAQVLELFGRLGTVTRLPEHLVEPATALSGVGPAYQALLAEAQVDAAVRHGLSAPLASRLVADTMAGTAALLESRGYDTLAVRREVTSPGGSTARGLSALEEAGVRSAFDDAMDAVISSSTEGGR